MYVVPVALAIYALFDLFRSEEHERSGLPPALWALIIIILPVLGPVVWIVTSTVRRAEAGPASARSAGPGMSRSLPSQTPRPRRPAGPTAPDDDPEFLRELERQWRREQREGDQGPTNPGDAPRA